MPSYLRVGELVWKPEMVSASVREFLAAGWNLRIVSKKPPVIEDGLMYGVMLWSWDAFTSFLFKGQKLALGEGGRAVSPQWSQRVMEVPPGLPGAGRWCIGHALSTPTLHLLLLSHYFIASSILYAAFSTVSFLRFTQNLSSLYLCFH